MSGRQRLPDRRANSSRTFEWHGSCWTVTVGWEWDGKVRELFLKGDGKNRYGSHLAIAAEDDAFIVSRLLQRGDSITDLADSLHRRRPAAADCDTGQDRPSLIAVAISVAADIEREEGNSVSFYLCAARQHAEQLALVLDIAAAGADGLGAVRDP